MQDSRGRILDACKWLNGSLADLHPFGFSIDYGLQTKFDLGLFSAGGEKDAPL